MNTAVTLTAANENDEALYRSPPQNIPAEQAILGAVLMNNDVLHRVGDFLEPEHFYEPVHQRIFKSIRQSLERGMVANPVTLKTVFDHDEALEALGGSAYLARLAGSVTSVINVESYGKTVYDLALKRRLITIGEDVVNHAYDPKIDLNAQQQIEAAEQHLFNLATAGSPERGFQSLKTSVTEALVRAEAAYKRKEAISGIPTKLNDMDRLLGGLQNSDLLILAGRPSMGKTALAINMAYNATKYLYHEHVDNKLEGLPPGVAFFSLEMSSEQLAARMIAMETGVNASKLRVGNMTEEEFSKLVRGSREMEKLPFFIDDTPALSISALRTRARRLKRQQNLKLIFVDYLQLLRGSNKSSEANRVQEVSEITQGLKAIAKELDLPVIALSQLSRAVESREDKRPQLSDLRESGSIEQDADIVMFIFREEYYISRTRPSEEESEKFREWQSKMERVVNRTEVIVAKQRHGPIGTATLHFDANTTRFSNDADERFEGYLP
jgi:replicative DNA helicase